MILIFMKNSVLFMYANTMNCVVIGVSNKIFYYEIKSYDCFCYYYDIVQPSIQCLHRGHEWS